MRSTLLLDSGKLSQYLLPDNSPLHRFKKLCQYCAGSFKFWILVAFITILEPFFCSYQPVGIVLLAQIWILGISTVLFVIQLIGVATREWDKIVMIQLLANSTLAVGGGASYTQIQGWKPLKLLVFFSAEGEYMLEFICLAGGWATIFTNPGLANLRLFRVFRLLWFYDVVVFKTTMERTFIPILGAKFVQRCFNIMKFAIKALSALANEMFRLTKATRGGLLLMMLFFYSAWVLGLVLWIETDNKFEEYCASLYSCSFMLVRLTFFDGDAFDFAYGLTDQHQFLFLVMMIYLCITAFGILNGLVGIFGTAFTLASAAAFTDEDEEDQADIDDFIDDEDESSSSDSGSGSGSSRGSSEVGDENDKITINGGDGVGDGVGDGGKDDNMNTTIKRGKAWGSASTQKFSAATTANSVANNDTGSRSRSSSIPPSGVPFSTTMAAATGSGAGAGINRSTSRKLSVGAPSRQGSNLGQIMEGMQWNDNDDAAEFDQPTSPNKQQQQQQHQGKAVTVKMAGSHSFKKYQIVPADSAHFTVGSELESADPSNVWGYNSDEEQQLEGEGEGEGEGEAGNGNRIAHGVLRHEYGDQQGRRSSASSVASRRRGSQQYHRRSSASSVGSRPSIASAAPMSMPMPMPVGESGSGVGGRWGGLRGRLFKHLPQQQQQQQHYDSQEEAVDHQQQLERERELAELRRQLAGQIGGQSDFFSRELKKLNRLNREAQHGGHAAAASAASVRGHTAGVASAGSMDGGGGMGTGMGTGIGSGGGEEGAIHKLNKKSKSSRALFSAVAAVTKIKAIQAVGDATITTTTTPGTAANANPSSRGSNGATAVAAGDESAHGGYPDATPGTANSDNNSNAQQKKSRWGMVSTGIQRAASFNRKQRNVIINNNDTTATKNSHNRSTPQLSPYIQVSTPAAAAASVNTKASSAGTSAKKPTSNALAAAAVGGFLGSAAYKPTYGGSASSKSTGTAGHHHHQQHRHHHHQQHRHHHHQQHSHQYSSGDMYNHNTSGQNEQDDSMALLSGPAGGGGGAAAGGDDISRASPVAERRRSTSNALSTLTQQIETMASDMNELRSDVKRMHQIIGSQNDMIVMMHTLLLERKHQASDAETTQTYNENNITSSSSKNNDNNDNNDNNNNNNNESNNTPTMFATTAKTAAVPVVAASAPVPSTGTNAGTVSVPVAGGAGGGGSSSSSLTALGKAPLQIDTTPVSNDGDSSTSASGDLNENNNNNNNNNDDNNNYSSNNSGSRAAYSSGQSVMFPSLLSPVQELLSPAIQQPRFTFSSLKHQHSINDGSSSGKVDSPDAVSEEVTKEIEVDDYNNNNINNNNSDGGSGASGGSCRRRDNDNNNNNNNNNDRETSAETTSGTFSAKSQEPVTGLSLSGSKSVPSNNRKSNQDTFIIDKDDDKGINTSSRDFAQSLIHNEFIFDSNNNSPMSPNISSGRFNSTNNNSDSGGGDNRSSSSSNNNINNNSRDNGNSNNDDNVWESALESAITSLDDDDRISTADANSRALFIKAPSPTKRKQQPPQQQQPPQPKQHKEEDQEAKQVLLE